MSKAHRYKAKSNGFFVSPYLQNLMALASVSDVYSKSNDSLNAFFGIDISESQVYRVTDCMGHLVAPSLFEEVRQAILEGDLHVYASIDGSMIQMDEKWQEAKLGGRHTGVFIGKTVG